MAFGRGFNSPRLHQFPVLSRSQLFRELNKINGLRGIRVRRCSLVAVAFRHQLQELPQNSKS